MANKIDRAIRRVDVYSNEKRIRLVVSPDVEAYFQAEGFERFKRLQKELKMTVELVADDLLARDELRLVSLTTNEEITDQVV
jgi:enolase